MGHVWLQATSVPLLLGVALTVNGRLEAQGERKTQADAAARLIGLQFTDAELELMMRKVGANLRSFKRLRREVLPNELYPALAFNPFLPGIVDRSVALPARELALPTRERPDDLKALAFADIETLASLIKSKRVSCVELTQMFLKRLTRLDKSLHCVITLTEKRALKTARQLDQEIAAGKYRGPLHGIPYGAKDLLAARGTRTTWGAKPFENQMLDYDATVVQRLEQAGAVLIAKLTLGALAWGDVWFGGKTRNPWNPQQGSSGSSAGPCSATAAGGVPFAIGSETYGSIVSPSSRCGTTGLRPTFGRISRHGAMTLSWSLDKLGPICRSATDCAFVMAAIHGADGKDPSARTKPFAMAKTANMKGLRVGYWESAFRNNEPGQKVLDNLSALGCELVEVELPSYPTGDMMFVLNAEAAAAFDEFTRSNRDDELVRQVAQAWPNVFRAARLIPAVEYIQANRLRTRLMRDFDKVMRNIDVLVHPPFAGGILALTNLTGHPTFIAPSGFRPNGPPRSICLTGQLDDDARLLAIAATWQAQTKHHHRHPDL